LKPNDRICIGPSAIFLFKNKGKEADASMPDPDEDPISFDFAADEVSKVENAAQLSANEKQKLALEEAAQKAVKEMEAKLEAEQKASADALKLKEAELAELLANGGNTAELEAQLEAQKKKNTELEADKLKKLLGEGMR